VVGGVHEFAVNEENCLLVDTLDDEAIHAALARLAGDPEFAAKLQRNGLETSERYSVAGAAISEYVTFAHAWQARQAARVRAGAVHS
jgi:glycosyltransferase involved in cell wall biosynthesis